MTESQPSPLHVRMRVKGVLIKPLNELLRESLEGGKKFCRALALDEDIISQIIDAENDWTFILKVDALLETAAREILRKHLHFRPTNRPENRDAIEKFLKSLNMGNEDAGILLLLKAGGFEREDIRFIAAVRRVRNAYAHNIKCLKVSLIEQIKKQDEHLLDRLSLIKAPKEEMFKTREGNANFLRFEITLLMLRFLNRAYHESFK